MNRIVKEHYPVEKLPEDLREGLDPQSSVTITLVPEGAGLTAKEALEALKSDTSSPRRTRQEIDEWVRLIREE